MQGLPALHRSAGGRRRQRPVTGRIGRRAWMAREYRRPARGPGEHLGTRAGHFPTAPRSEDPIAARCAPSVPTRSPARATAWPPRASRGDRSRIARRERGFVPAADGRDAHLGVWRGSTTIASIVQQWRGRFLAGPEGDTNAASASGRVRSSTPRVALRPYPADRQARRPAGLPFDRGPRGDRTWVSSPCRWRSRWRSGR
jgi:hypothetical protein